MTVLTPGENLKTKLIDSRGGTAVYNSTGQALSRMLAEGGIRGLYRGVVPVSLKQSANAVVRFTSYSYFLDSVSTALKEQDQPTSLAPAVAGGMAGIVTVYATMPFDNVKTKLQSIEGQRTYLGSIDCFRGIVRDSGIFGLWKGTTPRLIRLSVSGMISFSVYERVIAWTQNIEQPKSEIDAIAY